MVIRKKTMPKDIEVNTRLSEYDGLINVTFKNEVDGVVKKVDNIAVQEEKNAIEDQLNEDEQSGTKFMNAVRRYINVKYGVIVSIVDAGDYYKKLVALQEEFYKLFYPMPDVQDSTGQKSSDNQTP